MTGRGTFAAAVAATGGRMEEAAPGGGVTIPPGPAAPPTQDTVVDPRTGQVLADLNLEPTDRLADLVLEYRAREADLTTWRRLIETELRHRLEVEGRRLAVVGDYELQVDTGFRREWNADDLRYALDDLVRRGVISAGEIPEGLIRRTVNGTLALKVLNRLSGDPRELVEDCYRKVSTAPKLTVSRVPDLADVLPKP